MVLGFHSRPSHVAQNVIVGFDFDGCIAYGANAKIRFAKERWGLELAVWQTAEDVFPLGPQKYRQMMDVVGSARIMEYELAPGCKEVLGMLTGRGYPAVVITSRADIELYATDVYAEAHSLPLSGLFNTNRGSKLSLIERLKPAAFLDDTLSKLEQLIGTGTVLCFLKQEWNKHEWQKASELEQQGFIVPVNNWQHFYSRITGTDLAAARVTNNDQSSQ